MPILPQNLISIGSLAPNFLLPDQNGKMHSLKEYVGKIVLLYFYPKDSTPGCTLEACTIRDSYAEFIKNKIVVLGVSTDSIESHVKFTERFSLPFTLLSDAKKEVVTLYGVFGKQKFLGREYMGTTRSSFLIDRQGRIAKIYDKVKPSEHADEVLRDATTV